MTVEAQLVDLEQSKIKYHNLRTLISGKRPMNSYYVLSETILHVPLVKPTEFVINTGSDDSIKVGQAVMASDGIVGKVSKVDKQHAYVMPISHLSSKLPVTIPSGINLIAQGTGDGKLTLLYVKKIWQKNYKLVIKLLHLV